MIDAETRLCCLIGNPVRHSLSPRMHNAAFAATGQNYRYFAFQVEKKDLQVAVSGLNVLGARGFNVTIPHKVAVLGILDEIDATAVSAGAVNTVVANQNRLTGYNTDLEGFLQPLRRRGVGLQGLKVTILGAGGAARAAARALLSEGCASVTVLGRTPSKLRELSGALGESEGGELLAKDLTPANLQHATAESGILVNATPIGMYPNTSQSPLPPNTLRKDLIAYDLVYNPVKTLFLRQAEEAGATVVPGYEMLVAQGAAAFRLWTNIDPPIQVMEKAVLEGLRGDEGQS